MVLNELRLADGCRRTLRERCRVVLQSCPARRVLPRPTRHLRALMVGHLREEKDPRTYLRAAERLAARSDILLDHVGAALDPALGALAAGARRGAVRTTAGSARCRTRPRGGASRRAHVLVHPSRMEGGAHVVIEAVRSGTPVLASRIDGNVGLLGADYDGYFAPGDDAALATLLQRARDDADYAAGLAAPVRAARAAVRAAGRSATRCTACWPN